MSNATESAGNDTIVSRNRAIETMRKILRTALTIEKKMSIDDLAADSGVKVRAIQTYMSNDPTEQREPSLSTALSLMAIIGNRAVNSAVAVIGYTATPVDAVDARGPAQDAVEVVRHVSAFLTCAIDNHIDHTEEPVATDAADNVIELMTPYSSKGRAA